MQLCNAQCNIMVKSTFVSCIKKTFTLILIAIQLISIQSFAQNKKQQAEKYFKNYAYKQAIPLYIEIVNDNPTLAANLADCYRKTGDYKNAEKYYAIAVSNDKKNAQLMLHYGMMLLANGDCKSAKIWFDKFSVLEPKDKRGAELASSCTYAKEWKQYEAYYTVLPISTNSIYDDYAPSIYQNGIVFSSDRNRGGAVKRISSWTNAPFADLYYFLMDKYEDGNIELSSAVLFDENLNSKFHDATTAFTNDYKKVFFTRNNPKKDKNDVEQLQILSAEKRGNKWKNIQSLSFNSDEYSFAHPTLLQNGKVLIFSSNMPGGYGGMDIWLTFADGDKWLPPLNAGSGINTAGNEVFPYVSPDETLYFSSDGHAGFGGLDIYTSTINSGIFSEPINVGSPINSSADDFGIVIENNNTSGFFTSNRIGGKGGDDIYAFTRKTIQVEGIVVDKYTGKPIDNAIVKTNCIGAKTKSNKKGQFNLQLPIINECCFSMASEKYIQNAVCQDLSLYKKGDKIFVTITAELDIEVNLQGVFVDKSSGTPIAKGTVELYNNLDEKIATTTTGPNGEFSFPLQNGVCYELKLSANNYITAYGEKYCAKDLESSKTFIAKIEATPIPVIASNTDNIDELLSINNIYYNFNKSTLRTESIPELVKLVRMMKLYPEAILEVQSHTDSRGNASKNKILSQKRAQAVVNFLLRKGIERNRIIPIGYGEEQLLNQCNDMIKCTETEHEFNRRTSFKITYNGKIYESKIPQFINTEKCINCN
jgi:outer membrane protein OmpA-like peptidoglycan-associated protein/tetratricopeptide (TPR) repeat protein